MFEGKRHDRESSVHTFARKKNTNTVSRDNQLIYIKNSLV